MWDTGSARTNGLLVGLWVASAAVNVALMYRMPGSETVPFHLVWIGLSIVYGIAKDWGGTVTFTTSSGHGTTFEVLVPLITS